MGTLSGGPLAGGTTEHSAPPLSQRRGAPTALRRLIIRRPDRLATMALLPQTGAVESSSAPRKKAAPGGAAEKGRGNHADQNPGRSDGDRAVPHDRNSCG